MSERIDDVTVVGGGDSGLLAALAVRQLNPEIEVSVVDDFQRDVPQVGKSTFYKIYGLLHDFLDVDVERFNRSVRPIWKASVYFRDWCGCEPFHYPFDEHTKFPDATRPNAFQVYYYLHEEAHASNLTVGEELVEQGVSPWHYDPRSGGYQAYQPIAYHLDTDRFNRFLRELCEEREISLRDDEVVGADVSGDHVDRVYSEDRVYEADLYVDATGFARVLVGDLDREFRDFGFPLDTAYNARVERPLSEVIPATVVESGESGWFWHIDTYDDRDYGYVYASEFVSDDAALAEFVDHVEGDASEFDAGVEVSEDDVAQYEFTTGYYDDPWTGNLLPIGNAGGFVEPLESTGLTFNAEAAIRLSNLLSSHGRIDDAGIREEYNAWWRWCWESIYDFIAVHYAFAPGDTPFWERMQSMDVSPRVERIVEEYDKNGLAANVAPPTESGEEVQPLKVFEIENFYMLMRNTGRTSAFYDQNDVDVDRRLVRGVSQARRQRSEQVRENHISVEEYYRGVLE